ncbi:MAG: hypothetical protein EOO44_02040 [Flavobacterium sp.]|nr:MAG: hypothetical protein EOO44_02040 [Flavobacterium sp.]
MKIIKNLSAEKLTREELKQINGGTHPECHTGKVCYRGRDKNGIILWDCVPLTTECPDVE